jgi:hypothetical protein
LLHRAGIRRAAVSPIAAFDYDAAPGCWAKHQGRAE